MDTTKVSLAQKQQQRNHYCKLVDDILPTNTHVARYDPYRLSTCPRCHNAQEDRDHILRCPESDDWFDFMLQAIRRSMQLQLTDPTLTYILCTGLQEWRMNQPSTLRNLSEIYQDLVNEQQTLGWRQIFNGRWSKRWTQIQQEYYDSHQIQSKTGARWAKRILLGIWEHWEKPWQVRNEAFPPQRHNYIRTTHQLWPTAAVLAKRSRHGNYHDRRCKRCDTTQTETWTHLYRCPSESASQARTNFSTSLRLFLQAKKASKPMITAFLHGIQQWFDASPHTLPPELSSPDTSSPTDPILPHIQNAFHS